jgi:3-hydroxy acid dehydrogenase/malonic semialdehyde reductase
MEKIALITGATSGFGEACAIKFAANQFNLIINGRRVDRLQALQKTIQETYCVKVHVLAFDVQKQEDVFNAIKNLPEEWKNIDVLINNAGLALGRDFIEDGDLDDWNTMIDTNVKGLLYVSKAVIPLLIGNKKGHIVNLGSVAGLEVYEKGNVYCASKFAVEAISKGMRIDLLRHRIRVTAIHPGAAETEFSLVRLKGNESEAAKIYEGFKPLSAEDVADSVFYVCSLPEHVCINELVITCTQQANAYYFNKDTR